MVISLTTENINLWHRRLGHFNIDNIKGVKGNKYKTQFPNMCLQNEKQTLPQNKK